jgi:hypothetical protein
MARPFADLPLWGVFVGTLLLALTSVEVGYRLARQRQEVHELEKEVPVGAMVGATLGLLAFLLAFTFGNPADAFHARKEAVVKEASAIRMTYLLSDVTPQAYRAEFARCCVSTSTNDCAGPIGSPTSPAGRQEICSTGYGVRPP